MNLSRRQKVKIKYIVNIWKSNFYLNDLIALSLKRRETDEAFQHRATKTRKAIHVLNNSHDESYKLEFEEKKEDSNKPDDEALKSLKSLVNLQGQTKYYFYSDHYKETAYYKCYSRNCGGRAKCAIKTRDNKTRNNWIIKGKNKSK